MRKTIVTLATMLIALIMALCAAAGPVSKASPAGKDQVEFKGDTMIVSDGDNSVQIAGMSGMQKVRDKIDRVLDDTLTAGNGTTIEIGDRQGDLSPEDIKYMSDHWGEVVKEISRDFIIGMLALVLLVLLFRFLNRRNKYRVIERAIENNYPIESLPIGDARRSTVYVQQPVVTAAPQQPGQVPVGTPLSGATPDNPVAVGNVVNWRALTPAVKWLGWGLAFTLFGFAVGDLENPFWPVGLALMLVGLFKGFILYNEQKALQDAINRAAQNRPHEPMRSGSAVPPAFDQDYKADDDAPFQPY